MRSLLIAASSALALAGCASRPLAPIAPVEVQILAFNDFHGNLEPPGTSIPWSAPDGTEVRVPAGGVAYLAGALATLRQGREHSITVSAGDLVGGSPLTSALFLDEPTILAMDSLGLDLNAVGNHEFDRGREELLRMQNGGCSQFATRKPCALEPFAGARFRFLAANVLTEGGATLFPATAIRQFGPVRIGFIGMTLQGTGLIVTPAGVEGLTFADEASTANALVPQLKAAGADSIVLLIHEGGRLAEGAIDDPGCPGLVGAIVPILQKLDPAIELVVSGHTHRVYVCNVPTGTGSTRLLTSSGQYGTMVTDIRLKFAPGTRTLAGKSATLSIVQSEPFANFAGEVPLTGAVPVSTPDPNVAAIVQRYVAAAKPLAERIVARLPAAVLTTRDQHGAQRLGELVADAQLAWTRSSGAQVAFMNSGGVRGDLLPRPDGSVTYGQLFAIQPFGNGVVVQRLTGAQLLALLEQQFPPEIGELQPKLLSPSAGFRFEYDLTRPSGRRIVSATLNGKPIDPAASYRVTTNSFLASGGDGFSVLKAAAARLDTGSDLDALESYLSSSPPATRGGRVINVAAAASRPLPQPVSLVAAAARRSENLPYSAAIYGWTASTD